MKYDIIYETNRGQQINLTQFPYQLQLEPIFDYDWSYSTKSRKRGHLITGFTKDISEREQTLFIMGNTEEERNNAIDEFNSIIDVDIYDGTAGKLKVGDWYTYAYILGSTNERWQYGVPIIKKNIKIVKEGDVWWREQTRKSYEAIKPDMEDESGIKDYEEGYDYAFDYKTDVKSDAEIVNPSYIGSEFQVTIMGAVDSPSLTIGGTTLHFNINVPDGAYIVVDSTSKTAIMYTADNSKINVFSARDSEYNLFRRIDNGINTISWNYPFPWEIKLFEERSEPRWLTV